jgi:hypothetical protein
MPWDEAPEYGGLTPRLLLLIGATIIFAVVIFLVAWVTH